MGIAPLSASAKTKQTNIACTVDLTEVHGNVLKGADKGPISCASPLGDGTQSDTFKMKFNKAKTGGTGLVKFKDHFKGGTVSGTWKLKFKISGPAVSIAFHVVYTGGTGKFTFITGHGVGGGGLSSETTGSFQYSVKVPISPAQEDQAQSRWTHVLAEQWPHRQPDRRVMERYSDGSVKFGGTVNTGGIGAAPAAARLHGDVSSAGHGLRGPPVT